MFDMSSLSLELKMSPGICSAGGFLGRGDILGDVLKKDDELVKSLGLTHSIIADRIEYFLKKINYPSQKGAIIDEKYLVGGIAYRGGQECPWGDVGFSMPYSNLNLFATNLALNETVKFPGGIVHLIREHHFYEGFNSPYRVDPAIITRILDITP